MPELTPEQTTEIETQLDALIEKAVEKAGLRDINRKFTPGGDVNDPPSGDGEFKTFGQFLHSVKYNPGDARLKTGLSEGVDSEGGFLVPVQFVSKLMMMALEESVMRRIGPTIIPMTSDTADIPKIKDTTHASSLFGGVVAYWAEEGGTKTASEPTFGLLKLIAKELIGYTYASDALLADSAIALEALLLQIFGGALAWYEDEAFIAGDGVGKPFGILSSGALLSVNRSAATTVALADLANMWSRLLPQSHGRAVWLVNPTVLAQLVQLVSTTLTWLPMSQGAALTPPATLLGRPIYFTEKCKALGTAGDIVLVDPKYYVIGDRQQLTIASSIHTRFTTNQTAWRFVQRVDGQPWVDSAFTPKNGSTLSPFVTLHSTTNGGD